MQYYDYKEFMDLVVYMSDGYNRKKDEKFIKNLFSDVRDEDFGVVKSSLKLIKDDPNVLKFPTPGQIKAKINEFKSMHGDIIKKAKEIPCDRCLGKGFFDATYEFSRIKYLASFRCNCPNGNKAQALPYMPKGVVVRLYGDEYKKEICYTPVVEEISYSEKAASPELRKKLFDEVRELLTAKGV